MQTLMAGSAGIDWSEESLMKLIDGPILGGNGIQVKNDPTQDVDLLKKTVCLSVSLRQWGIRRKVDPDDVGVNAADKERIKISKQILESPEVKAISKFLSQVDSWLDRMALPSDIMKRGFHLIALDTVTMIDEQLLEHRKTLFQLVEDLIQVYPEQKAAAKLHLEKVRIGDQTYNLYREADYPTPEALRDLFEIDVDYVQLAAPQNIAQVSEVIYNRQLKKQEAEMAKMFEEVRQGLRAGLQDLTAHLIDRLKVGPDGKPKTFKKTTVSFFKEFLEVFDAKNITDDSQLKSVVDKAKQLMDGVNPDLLRKDGTVREEILKGLTSVKGSLDSLVQIGPGRKLHLQD